MMKRLEEVGLKDLRVAFGWLQTDFARMIGVSRATLIKLEDGRVPFDGVYLRAAFVVFFVATQKIESSLAVSPDPYLRDRLDSTYQMLAFVFGVVEFSLVEFGRVIEGGEIDET